MLVNILKLGFLLSVSVGSAYLVYLAALYIVSPLVSRISAFIAWWIVTTFINSRIWPRTKENSCQVSFDESHLFVSDPTGNNEKITWKDVEEIGIVTTDEGPWVEDVFWFFLGPNKEQDCVVPSESLGIKELMEELQHRFSWKLITPKNYDVDSA